MITVMESILLNTLRVESRINSAAIIVLLAIRQMGSYPHSIVDFSRTMKRRKKGTLFPFYVFNISPKENLPCVAGI